MRKIYRKIMSGICVMPLLTACTNRAEIAKTADIFAMDTYMNLKAYGRDAEAAVSESEARIRELEQIFSVTDDTSDIRQINQAGGQPVTVSADTVSVLQIAQHMNQESGGAFSISLYPVLRAWGFTTGKYRIPADDEIAALLKKVDDTRISMDDQTVRCPAGTEIDLGAVAKGYTGDAVIKIMRTHQISSAIINLGGNVQTFGSKPDGSAWSIGITDPFSPDSLIGTVSVTDKAVITSGNYERYFTAEEGKRYWHILDPADGCPADNGLVSVTVIGDCGAECDALSTALFVERHSKVEYVVAHGISSMIDGERVVIGSHHFVVEDEACKIPDERIFRHLPKEYSHLYLAIGGEIAAVICIEDPLRDEAKAVIDTLHALGIPNIVMMTGDNERTARSVAEKVGVDLCFSEVLPEDKAAFIRAEHNAGRRVIMIGDGVNDSPALSESDAGIAISTGAAIAREIADITISANDLYALISLKKLSDALMQRISRNYRTIIGFNLGLILLGAAGILPPATTALLHNASTLAIGLKSMTDLKV